MSGRDKEKDREHDSKKRKEPAAGLSTRTGGAYIPPAKLRMMQKNIEDKSSAEYQRLAWEQLKKSINGLINKVNTSNITTIVRELIKQNLVRGRGLLCRSIMQAQSASQTFTNVYAALVAIINSKFPNIGELLLKRLIIQFRRGYKRNDKPTCLSAAKFIAHLVNQQVAHEVLALEIVTLLLEHPTEDSVEVAIAFLKECGCRLEEVSPRGSHAIFERLRHVLHEGHLEKRVQYMIEVMFQVRKDKFKDFPTLPEELDLVEEEDQFTHLITLDEVTEGQDILNVFKVDQDFIENEDKYATLKKEILDESEDEGDGDGEEEDEDDDEEEGEDAEEKETILDKTETNLLALRRTIYLTIQSSLDFEECCHKVLKLNLKEGQEVELCHMILDCCAQQRTYEKFFGLLAQRFCNLPMGKKYIEPFQQIFKDTYDTVHRLDTNKLRNVAKFFAHLLFTDAIGWGVMEHIKLTEDETTSSSRIFIKILMQELSEYMGLQKLNQRLQDPTLMQHFEGLFPRDHPKNTRFSINFFTSIGLGGLTDELREFLKKQPKPTAVIAPQRNESGDPDEDGDSSSSSSSSSDDSSSDSSDSSSSGSSSSSDGSSSSSGSSSSDSSSSDESDADARKKKKKKVSSKKQSKKASKSKKSMSPSVSPPKRGSAKMSKRAGKEDKNAKKDSKKAQQDKNRDRNRDRSPGPEDFIRETVDEKLRALRYESDRRNQNRDRERGEHSRNEPERLAIRERERSTSTERQRRIALESLERADRDRNRRSRMERPRSIDRIEDDRQRQSEPEGRKGRGRSRSPSPNADMDRRGRRERSRSNDNRKIMERAEVENVDRRSRKCRSRSRSPERRVSERSEQIERRDRSRRDRSGSEERRRMAELPRSSERETQARRDRSRSRSDDRRKIRGRSRSVSNEPRKMIEMPKSSERSGRRDRSRSDERRAIAEAEAPRSSEKQRRKDRSRSRSVERRIVRDRPDGTGIEWRTKQDLERHKERQREPSESPERRIRNEPEDRGRRRERSRSDDRRKLVEEPERPSRYEKSRIEEKSRGRERSISRDADRSKIRERSGSPIARRLDRSRSDDRSPVKRRRRSESGDRQKSKDDSRRKRREKFNSDVEEEAEVVVDKKTRQRSRSRSNEKPKKSKRSKSGDKDKHKKRKRSRSDDGKKRRKRSESGERDSYRRDESEEKPLVGYWDMADELSREKNRERERESRRRRRERSVS